MKKKIETFENIIKNGNVGLDIQKKMMLFLLNKSNENSLKQKAYKIKLKEINDQKLNYNLQIQNWNNQIENQNIFLKKIKSLYIFLITLLCRKKYHQENKLSIGNNDINKNKGGKYQLVDFIHRYIDYHAKNKMGLSSIINNKLNNNIKNSLFKNKTISNIVQKGETFSINNENFSFDDYINKIELLSMKSFKSGKLNDSLSFSAEDNNFNSSFSVIGSNNNLFNYDNANCNLNETFLNEQNSITHNFNNYNNNINNSSFFL